MAPMQTSSDEVHVCADQATFRRGNRDGYRTLTVTGEIDLATTPRFEAELSAVISEAHSPADVDLSGVTFIDSSGLYALIRARKQVTDTDVRLVLVNPSRACRLVLEVTGTAQLFEITTTTGP
jgi:anti-sigma B factor antagonist